MFYVLVFWSRGMWALSSLQPGIEPAPPALEDEVLTTGPPGKSLNAFYKKSITKHIRARTQAEVS